MDCRQFFRIPKFFKPLASPRVYLSLDRSVIFLTRMDTDDALRRTDEAAPQRITRRHCRRGVPKFMSRPTGSPAGPQIVEQLRRMRVGQTRDGLQFDDDPIGDHDVGHIDAHALVSIVDGEGLFRLNSHARKAQFLDKRVSIDSLEKAMSKAVGDGEPGADDAFGQTVQLRIQARSHRHPSVRRQAPSAFIRVLYTQRIQCLIDPVVSGRGLS